MEVGGQLSENNNYLVQLLGLGGKFAVNCFVLITGYFGVTGTNTKSKIVRLWLDRLFYSLLISIILLILHQYTISSAYVLRAVFPVITCRHNYITTFIMLYLFIPFINKLIHSLSQKELAGLLGISTIVLSLHPTIVTLTKLYTNNTYSYLLWMIYLYCIGAYMRLYPVKLPWKLLSVISVAVLLLMTFVVEPNSAILPNGYTTSTQHNTILLISSVICLGFFVNLKLPYSRGINGLASSTFAVLLIHDDPLVRGVLWTKVFRNADYGSSQWLWLHALLTVLIVYVACIAVDKLYVYVIKKPIEKIINSKKSCQEVN